MELTVANAYSSSVNIISLLSCSLFTTSTKEVVFLPAYGVGNGWLKDDLISVVIHIFVRMQKKPQKFIKIPQVNNGRDFKKSYLCHNLMDYIKSMSLSSLETSSGSDPDLKISNVIMANPTDTQ